MARLPQPGGDDGNWGAILNDYLTQSLTTTGDIRSNAVGTAAVSDEAITEAKLAASVKAKLNATPPVPANATTTTAGIVQLATPAEVQAGTNTTKAVTAEGVKAAIDQSVRQVIFVDSLATIPGGTPVDTLVVVRS